jgi:hypothetical protein
LTPATPLLGPEARAEEGSLASHAGRGDHARGGLRRHAAQCERRPGPDGEEAASRWQGAHAARTAPTGLALISYTGGGLRVAHCENPACTSATSTVIESNVHAPSSIVVGADGIALIVYGI